MDQLTGITLYLAIALAISICSFLAYLFWQQRKEAEKAPVSTGGGGNIQLQLQAYERLTLLVDRIALPNLIGKVGQIQVSAREMQALINQTIKQEYEYNISQQIYVSADAWNAVKNLKEQNMLVVNQIANLLPPDATSLDLSKLLLEYLMTNDKGALHEIVSNVLSYEAKKIL